MSFQSILTKESVGKARKENIKERKASSSLWQFIFHTQANRRYFWIALAGTIIQFIIFKILYPFPDFISDSYSYIATNIYHMDVNLWPIGYSKFLLLVHAVSHSDTFLVAVQYFLLEASLAYFFYTILYLYGPAKNTTVILFIFLFFNPLFLYLSNCVLSDALFSALSIVFLSQFLWMLHRPTTGQVLLQGIIIGLAFTIRYAAIYYPLVAIAGFLLSQQRLAVKIWGILLGIILMMPFYYYTQQKTREVTGTAEFSVFGGWQIANNALYMYDHINVDSNKLPPETRALDRLSKQFFLKVPPKPGELAALPGTYFIKVPWAILKPYMAAHYTYTDPPGQFRAWGMVSPIYNKYGTYLITHYPYAFAQYYLWLNTKNYFLPHLEKFGNYNLAINTIPAHVQDWFDYITPNINSISATFQGKLFYIYPILFMVLNTYFIAYMIWIFLTGGFKRLSQNFRPTVQFISIFLLLNFGFSVFATPVVLRYQVVPMTILFVFSLLLLEAPSNLNQKDQTK